MTQRYPIYGGPLSGRDAEISGTIYCERDRMPALMITEAPSPRPDEALYEYVLRDIGSGVQAFLPTFNDDLLRAYQRTDGEPGNPEADALLAEIQRREFDL